jgi:acyl-CoA thioester hydrolase
MNDSSGRPFRFHYAVDVRFRDIDAMGHAHHSLPLVYAEEARAAYWRDVAGRADISETDYVLVEVTVRYHRRIRFPGRLDVALRTARIGAKSIVMEFEIRDENGDLLASGQTVQVMYDFGAQISAAVAPDLRARIESFEGGISL